MGRNNLPTALKKAKGTLRKSRVNEDEPETQALKSVPVPPKRFTKVEKQTYYDTAYMLFEWGLLDSVSIYTLRAYSKCWSTYEKAVTKCEELGEVVTDDKGNLKVNPWFRVASNSLDKMLSIGREYGFTPSSRAKVKALVKPKKKGGGGKFNI